MFKSKNFILAAPALFGVLLVFITLFDLYQFRAGNIEVRSMLSRELPIVLLGLLSSLVLLVLGIYWLAKRQWRDAIFSLSSILVFLILFAVGGTLGAAYLNAT